MADGLVRKPAKRHHTFSGTSRKDSVKALRVSRSLNRRRRTSETSKRQVGTEVCGSGKFPLALKRALMLSVNSLSLKKHFITFYFIERVIQ